MTFCKKIQEYRYQSSTWKWYARFKLIYPNVMLRKLKVVIITCSWVLTVEDTIQEGWRSLKINIIGYKNEILSNHRTWFDLTARQKSITTGNVVLKLWHLKNAGIKTSQSNFSKIIYIFNPKNFPPSKQESCWAIGENFESGGIIWTCGYWRIGRRR